MKRDFRRLMRAASQARGSSFLDRVIDGVVAWAQAGPSTQPGARSVARPADAVRVDARPVEVVEAEIIDE